MLKSMLNMLLTLNSFFFLRKSRYKIRYKALFCRKIVDVIEIFTCIGLKAPFSFAITC